MGSVKLVITAILSVFLISCDNDENIIFDNSFNIEFSAPPIDLNGIQANFAENISYGEFTENVFDIFLPVSDTPTALVIYIHGGGFVSCDKEYVYNTQKDGLWDFPEEIRTFLSNNIAYATINYRLFEAEENVGVIKPLTDCKRCLQYIRSISDELNIDKGKIVLSGNSAGAGTSLWLAFNDDMASVSNTDPVLMESTRALGLAVRETQATYDLERWETDVFIDYNFSLEDTVNLYPSVAQRINSFYGITDFDDFYSPEIVSYRNDVDMLDLMSSDDPEIWVNNTLRDVVPPTTIELLNHHPYHARELKEHADSLGIPNVAYYGDYSDPSDEDFVSFLIRKLEE